MSKSNKFRELTVLPPATEEGVYKLVDASGGVHAEVLSQEDAYRFAECWNALRTISFPAAHVEATEQKISKERELRQWQASRIAELEKELVQLRASKVAA